MVLKRSVFGTYVKEGLSYEKKETEKKRKGFMVPPKRKIKLKNPFEVYNYIFKYNRDYTRVPTHLFKNKHNIMNKNKAIK